MRMNQDERRFDFHGLGAALKRAREEKGWTQAYVAELVDRDSRTIMNIENKGQYPSFDLFVKLITMFDVSVDQFIHADGGARSSSCRKHIDVLLNSMNEKELGKLMGTTEVESFVAVANMFLGQTDSPILVSKYIGNLTDSEILVILVSGMGSMSVSILGGYHALGIPMEYLLIASALVPVGSILVAKMLLPQTEPVQSITDVKMDNKGNNANVIDAIAEGAGTGMQMVIAIAASLVGIIGIVAVINMILGFAGISLEQIFSYVFAPFGFLMGLDTNQVLMEGAFLGNKLIVNEFVAFQDLGKILSSLDYRTGIVCSISLCGFANLSSLGICVSGIAVLCPEKKSTLSRLVFRAMLGGVFVSILSAMIVGLITLF